MTGTFSNKTTKAQFRRQTVHIFDDNQIRRFLIKEITVDQIDRPVIDWEKIPALTKITIRDCSLD